MPGLNTYLSALSAADRDERLVAVGRLAEAERNGSVTFPPAADDVNSHIHSIYSFSPYSPSLAVAKSRLAGLATSGIMDHDSVAGAREFLAAGRALSMPVTVGAEVRASFAGTFLENSRINNPDQDGVAYVALHGIPHQRLDAVDAFLRPIREARAARNRIMAGRLEALFAPYGITVTYDQALALSEWQEGGEVTERHLLYAATRAIVAQRSADLIAFLTDELKLALSDSLRSRLADVDNPHRLYDLLGLLKSELVTRFYEPAGGAECPPIQDLVRLARDNGVILAYPYLGDITASVTGDKKAQTFEDAYLDRLFQLLAELGFAAVTYMPSRNTPEQLDRLMALAERYDFFQISGEDINQSRQSFVCEAMRDPRFDHLKTAAYALIGHERAASQNLADGFFADETRARLPNLKERIEVFAALGRGKE